MRDQYRLAEARGDRRRGVADMDHERAAADRGAVDPFSRSRRDKGHHHLSARVRIGNLCLVTAGGVSYDRKDRLAADRYA